MAVLMAVSFEPLSFEEMAGVGSTIAFSKENLLT
jgi:hypothetical protein